MSNYLDLEILNKTYEYLCENCVGPQSCYSVFNSIKKNYQEESFNYQFFISLFNNQETINKSQVKEFISKYDSLQQTHSDQVLIQNSENKKSDIYKRKKIEDKKLPNEYYYFTKTNGVLKIDVLKHIENCFIENNNKNLDIKIIYGYLTKLYNISSVNMKNLKSLLKSDKVVLLSVVKELIVQYSEEYIDEIEMNFFDIKSFVVNKSEKLLQCVKILGLEVIKDIIKNGLNKYVTFLQACAESNLNFDTSIGQTNISIDKIFENNDADFLIGFLNIFNENELIELLNNKQNINELIEMYIEDEKIKIHKIKFAEKIKELLYKINEDNKIAKIKYLLPYEVVHTFIKENIFTIKDICSMDYLKFTQLYQYKQIIINHINFLQQSLPAYINEKFKLLLQRVNDSNVPNSLYKKYIETLSYRELGYNLEETARFFDMTREGIRQTEKKYLILFDKFFNNQNWNLTKLIRAFSKNEYFLTPNDIESIISFYPKLFIYLLKNTGSIQDLIYIEELDIFYFIDEIDWYKEILVVSEQMEDVIDIINIEKIINETYNKLVNLGVDLPKEFCEKILKQDYKQNGTILSRNKMRLGAKYKQVLEKYFPMGIRIYDTKETSLFREKYFEIYKDDKLPQNDRALYGRITSICYLKGKGLYQLKKNYYMSEELASQIYNYIISSQREVFLTNTIFANFHDKLIKEGILDKYNLQGVLKEIYGDKLYFSRDYISKNDQKSSIYSEIYDFVKQTGREISFNEIQNEFNSVPDYVLYMALSSDNILNVWKSYLHVDNLKIDQQDIDRMDILLSQIVADHKIHNAHDLFIFIDIKDKEFLLKYQISGQFKLFSILAFLYQDKFEFQRPFFAEKGIEIGYQKERILEFVREHDELNIDELLEFVYDNKLHLYSIVDLIDNDLKNEYVFKDKNTLILIEKTNINKYNSAIAEDVILKAMKTEDFIVSSKFNGYNFLPREVKWTDWLLYSAINKYGTNLKVIQSGIQMKHSEPIFVKKNIQVNNINELIAFEKSHLKMDEICLINYLKNKGLIE